MIYCPECGTANRDGSKFCNECGHTLLAQTGVKCPQCDTLNAVQSVFCSHCGGRLLSQPTPVPSTITPPIKGLSLPTKTTVGEGEEDVDHLPAEDLVPLIPAIESPIRSPRSEGAGELIEEEGEEIPDWLRDLQASLPVEPELEAPEPQFALQPSPPTPEAEAEQVSEPHLTEEIEQPPEAPPAISEKTPQEVEQMPDWLAELKPQASIAEPERLPTPPLPSDKEELPSWLAELRPAAGVEAPAGPSVEVDLEAEELPSWLAELKSAAGVEAPAGPSADADLEAEALPSWLAELKPVAGLEAPAGPSADAELQAEELPSWLDELKSAAGVEAPAGPSVEAEPEEEELPAWLAELKPPAAAEASELQPLPTVEAPLPGPKGELEEEELPLWLADLKAEREPFPSVSPEGPKVEEAAVTGSAIGAWQEEAPSEEIGPQPAPLAAEEVSEAQAIPGWLAGLVVAQAPLEVTPSEGDLPDWLVPTPELGIPGEEETLARAEIPDWLLALKPRELKAEGEAVETVVEAAVEQTGVLAGIRDVLPVEMLIAQPRAATPAEVMESPFSAEEALVGVPGVRLFEEIVSRPLVAAPKAVTKPRSRLLDLLPWWIVYALLTLAVTVPLLLGTPLFDRSIEPAPSVETLYEAIESLPGNAQVLVAVDYDPTTSGEMDIVAEPIVSHLMDRQARIVTFSLLPAGPATAENLVTALADNHPSYQTDNGQLYVNLGYLPGQAAAVRLMGQSLPDALPRDFEGRPVTDLAALSGITATQSFDLIVELAATPDTLRWWVEQAGAPYGVSLVAGVSAVVDPMARTYYETEPQQLQGLIGGVPGAASYSTLQSGGAGPDPEMAARLDSLLAGQVLVILVILGGAIAGRNRSRPKKVAQRGMGREQ